MRIDGKNEFAYTLPHTNTAITYKLLTNRDEKKIEAEIKGLKKINKQASPELSTRLKFMITSVSGDVEILISAFDNIGVTSVNLYINGTNIIVDGGALNLNKAII